MVDLSLTVPIITISINGLNLLLKGKRLPHWIKKQVSNIFIYVLENKDFRYKDTNRLKVFVNFRENICNQENIRTFHNSKGVYSPRRCKTYQCLFT